VSVSGIENPPPATFWQATAGSGSAAGAGSKDKDMFLQLLVAQMKYQDPSNPADSTQFLTQTAQFTSLEKMEAIADQTMQMVGLQAAFGASAMLGQQVSYLGANGRVETGTVDSVRFEVNGPVLSVNGASVPMPMILSLAHATPPSGPAASSTTPTQA
jgi:flagellar basal-body rod modification protein FlgD